MTDQESVKSVETLQITGFPTILLFPAGASPKRHVMYQGSRQPDDMIRWLHQECAISFDDRPPAPKEGEDPVESGLLDPDEEDL
ncbi:RNR1 [Symbiodinium pilosum]|uniref:RNR1 protein n=1 Tax=Symbiodinium pilosum TaxID=2952 RepID=A0A812SD66_SYMPI|nr:RNR1 [Symbiodinium pilosum]